MVEIRNRQKKSRKRDFHPKSLYFPNKCRCSVRIYKIIIQNGKKKEENIRNRAEGTHTAMPLRMTSS